MTEAVSEQDPKKKELPAIGLVDAIRAFNRKERYLLVGWALDRATFSLGHEFRQALSKETGLEVPADAYVAMDYHLTWLYCAMMWAAGQVKLNEPVPFEENRSPFKANIEDVDLLVAFAQGIEHHVILIEAKGYTPWGANQIQHKLDRLHQMLFDGDSPLFPGVSVHLVFVGSVAPLVKASWPKWVFKPDEMDVRFLPLPQPASQKVLVGRCDKAGKESSTGGHWVIRQTPWPG